MGSTQSSLITSPSPLEGQFDVVLVDGRVGHRVSNVCTMTGCSSRVVCCFCTTRTGLRNRKHCSSSAHGPTCVACVARQRDAARSGEDVAADSPTPPQVRSGESMQQLTTVFDRELYFYLAPDADDDERVVRQKATRSRNDLPCAPERNPSFTTWRSAAMNSLRSSTTHSSRGAGAPDCGTG